MTEWGRWFWCLAGACETKRGAQGVPGSEEEFKKWCNNDVVWLEAGPDPSWLPRMSLCFFQNTLSKGQWVAGVFLWLGPFSLRPLWALSKWMQLRPFSLCQTCLGLQTFMDASWLIHNREDISEWLPCNLLIYFKVTVGQSGLNQIPN